MTNWTTASAPLAHAGPRHEAEPAMLVEPVDDGGERHRDADPDRGPEERLPHRELGRLAVQHAEIEEQQREEKREEAAPDEFDHAGSRSRPPHDRGPRQGHGMSSTASFSRCTGIRSRAVSLRSSATELAM